MIFVQRMLLVAATIAAVVVLAPAAVDSVTPLSVAEGTVITVTGSGFGTSPAAFLVNDPDRIALKRLAKPKPTDASFQAVVKKARAGVYSIEVTPKGAAAPFVLPGITYEIPQIAQITPNSGAAGSLVTVSGAYFGKSKGSVVIACAAAKVKKWDGVAGTVTFVLPVGVPLGQRDVAVVSAAGDASLAAGPNFEVTASGGTGQAIAGNFGYDCFNADQKGNYGSDATTGPDRVLTVTALRRAGGIQRYLFMQVTVPATTNFPATVDGTVHYIVSRTKTQEVLANYQSTAGTASITISSVAGGFVNGSFSGTITPLAGPPAFGAVADCIGQFQAKIQP